MSIELSLYKLADALQIPLDYQDGKVSGSMTGKLKTTVAGLEIPITAKATKLFMNDQCGVVADIAGDLAVIVAHYPKTGSVSAYLLNKDKLMMDGVKAPPDLFISKKMTLMEVMQSVRKAVVRAFYYKDGKWKPLTLPTW